MYISNSPGSKARGKAAGPGARLQVVRLLRGGERCRGLRVEEEVPEVWVLGRPAVEEARGIVHEG